MPQPEPTAASSDYAVRMTWRGVGPFLSQGEREYVEQRIVTAKSMDDAIREAVFRCSMLSLKYGVTVEAARISWARSTRRLAKYDAEPMLDHALANPRAKLVISHV